MKQFKKLLCILITLSIVMTSFSAFAKTYLTPYEFMDDVFEFDVGDFAAGSGGEADLSDPAFQRIRLLDSLGVWDDASKEKDAFLTMTEFSIIMSKLRLGSENAFVKVYEKDPDNTKVTYALAYEYLLDALGYYYKCQAYDYSDEGLIIVANEIDLISDKPENIGAYITRAELSKLVAKALTIDMCVLETTSTGLYRHEVVEGQNLLNTIHNIYYVEGFANAIPGLSVFGGDNLKEGFIEIDRTKYNAMGLDVKQYLGAPVKLYAKHNEATNEREIIFIDYLNDTSVYEFDFRDILELKADEIVYKVEDGTEESISFGPLSYIVENGEILSSVDEISDFTAEEGKIILSSSEGTDNLDTLMVYKYDYYILEYNDTRNYRLGLKYYQKYNGSTVIQLDDSAEMDVYIDGVKSEYESILAGAAIRFMMCPSTGYAEIIASTTKLNNSVTTMYDDVVEIAGKEYFMTRDLVQHIADCKTDNTIPASQKVKELDVGQSSTFYVIDNMLVGYAAAQEYLFGYLTAVSRGRSSLDTTLTLKLLDQDANWRVLTTPEKFTLDGKNNCTSDDLYSLGEATDWAITNELVRFKANSNNEITALDTINETSYEAGTVDDLGTGSVYNFNYVLNWTYTWLKNDCPYWLKTSTVIFVIPPGETDESKFRVVNNTALPGSSDTTNGTIPMKFYCIDDLNRVGAAIATRDLNDIGASSNGGYVYIESITKIVVDAENFEYGYKIKGKQAKPSATLFASTLGDVTFTVEESVLDKNAVSAADPAYDINKRMEKGDLINITVSGGRGSTWTMALKGGKVPEPTPLGTTDETGAVVKDKADGTTTSTTIVGEIVAIDYAEEMALVKVNIGNSYASYPFQLRSKMLIDYNTDTVEKGDIADFYVGDKIWFYSNYGRVSIVVKNQ